MSAMIAVSGFSQENYKNKEPKDAKKVYKGGEFYKVRKYKEPKSKKAPKNIIFLIGDGMSLAQISAGFTANGASLNMTNFKKVGLSTTFSSDNYTTDSAAGGTALSTGKKTTNGTVGLDAKGKKVENLREVAEKKDKATGVVSTSSITHATPASFVAHQPKRKMYEAIAADFLKTDIDVFIGGGYKHFTERKDGKNLVDELKKKGYTVLQDLDKISKVKEGKLAGLTAPEHNGRVAERGDMLQVATTTAIDILEEDKDGFFLMVEGSQIDWAGHQNNTNYIVEEMLDFDKAVGIALKFAAKDKNTLVVVTADHETGGFAINGGNPKTGKVKGGFTTGGHTPIMVPVFAFGPGSENFTGFMDNTDIAKRIKKLIK